MYYCFKCIKEGHKPSACELVENWNKKNLANSGEFVKMDNYRNCPHCKIMIERESGCNRMHCDKSVGGCGKNFCWRCMGDHGYDFMDFNKDPRGGCSKAEEIEKNENSEEYQDLVNKRIADPDLLKYKTYFDR